MRCFATAFDAASRAGQRAYPGLVRLTSLAGRTPRPAGWLASDFTVLDFAGKVFTELPVSAHTECWYTMSIMGEQDRDTVVARMVGEKNELNEKQLALDAELEYMRAAFQAVVLSINLNNEEAALARLETIRKFVSVDAIRQLLADRRENRARLLVLLNKLREFGVKS
jgi:hypothetical protein